MILASAFTQMGSKVSRARRQLGKNPLTNFKIALHWRHASRAVEQKDVAKVLACMAKLEQLRETCPRKSAKYITSLLSHENGREQLCRAASALLERYPHSPLLVYLRAVSLAKAGDIDAAYETVNHALHRFHAEQLRRRGTRARLQPQELKRFQQLNGIWEVVDWIGHQAMSWPIPNPNVAESLEELAADAEHAESSETAAAAILAEATHLREARRQDDYLNACKRSFNAATTLPQRAEAIQAMIRTGRRRMPDYHPAYALARQCYLEIRPQWIGRSKSGPAPVHSTEHLESEADVRLLTTMLRLAHDLDFPDDVSHIADTLVQLVQESNASNFRWLAAAALVKIPSNENTIAAARMIADTKKWPRTKSEIKSFFTWAEQADAFSQAHTLYESMPPAYRRTTAVLSYANICEREGCFQFAADIISDVATEMLRRPHTLPYMQHWRLCYRRKGELMFQHETWARYSNVPQPKAPKGVIFVSIIKYPLLRTLPLVVLMELKRQGWAVVPLVEGILPPDPTGNPKIDQYIWCIRKTGTLKDPSMFPSATADDWDVDIRRGVLRWRDVDLSYAMWESASINRRRYSIDCSCPALIDFFQNMVRWMRSYVEVLEHIRFMLGKDNVPVTFILGDLHRLPNAAIRHYCEHYGDPKRFFCTHATNAYENYFANFASNVSTRMSLRNMTASPHMRTAFLPEPSEFEAWYRSNADQAPGMLRRVQDVTKMRRSTGDAGRSADAEACLDRIAAWRENGGNVACLFGKVVCDLAVPYDGGPVHRDMKDWLNHTIDAVRGSSVLLLIKPHPHELKNDIGLFLTEHFEDLIEGEVPDNAIVLGHRWLDIHDLNGRIDLGLLWNGTTAVELGLLNIPAVLCSHFGPIDYPVGHAAPRDRAQYERFVRFEEPVRVAEDLKVKSAAWLTYLNSEEVSVPYRYYACQVTNRVIYPPWWFQEDIEAYLRHGDPHVERLAARVTGTCMNAHRPLQMERELPTDLADASPRAG